MGCCGSSNYDDDNGVRDIPAEYDHDNPVTKRVIETIKVEAQIVNVALSLFTSSSSSHSILLMFYMLFFMQYLLYVVVLPSAADNMSGFVSMIIVINKIFNVTNKMQF